jgi:hypothetical protein
MACVLIVGAWTGWSRGDDPADHTPRRSLVAAQKVESEMRAALLEAQKLAAKDPEKAEELLKRSLSKLDDDSDLPEARRAQFQRVFKDRLRILRLPADKTATQGAEKKAEPDNKADTGEDVNRRLKTIKDAFKDDKPEEAGRQVKDLERRLPGSPAVAAARRTGGIAGRVADAGRVRRESEERLVGVGREVERSSLAPAGDIEFPAAKKWQELTERRKKENLTKAEKAILKALETPIKVDFRNSKLEDVVDYLQTTLDIPIFLNQHALDQASVTYDTLITKTFKRPVATQTALRSILGDLGLTYVLKDETLEILTPEMAKALMVVKVYPVGDLVLIGENGRRASPLEELLNAARLIELIKSSTDAGSWDEEGGATIAYEPGTHAIVVRQSALVHSMLGKSLR